MKITGMEYATTTHHSCAVRWHTEVPVLVIYPYPFPYPYPYAYPYAYPLP